MEELIENAVRKSLSESVDGAMFYSLRCRNGKAIGKLANSVENLIAENGLSVSEAKGFLEYMKIVISSHAHFPIER